MLEEGHQAILSEEETARGMAEINWHAPPEKSYA